MRLASEKGAEAGVVDGQRVVHFVSELGRAGDDVKQRAHAAAVEDACCRQRRLHGERVPVWGTRDPQFAASCIADGSHWSTASADGAAGVKRRGPRGRAVFDDVSATAMAEMLSQALFVR